MEGSTFAWRLSHTPPNNGPVTHTVVRITITGPGLSHQTLNHMIFDIIVADLFQNFPPEHWQELPNAIILDYPNNSDMLNGLKITLAGHGTGNILLCSFTLIGGRE